MDFITELKTVVKNSDKLHILMCKYKIIMACNIQGDNIIQCDFLIYIITTVHKKWTQ